MRRTITVERLSGRLQAELDSLAGSQDVLFITRRGRVAGVMLDAAQYADLVERLDFLADSVAARRAREERHLAERWSGIEPS